MAEHRLDAQGRPIPDSHIAHGLAYPFQKSMEGQPGMVPLDHDMSEDTPQGQGVIAEGLCQDHQNQVFKEWMEDKTVDLATIEQERGVQKGYLTEDLLPNVWKRNANREPIAPVAHSIPSGKVEIKSNIPDEERPLWEAELRAAKAKVAEDKEEIARLNAEIAALKGEQGETEKTKRRGRPARGQE